MGSPSRILYCRCAYARIIPKETKDEVLQKLCESGVAFDSVPDLCEMSARKDAALKRLADGGNLKIAACYPRAVRWLFSAAQAPLEGGSYQVLNMRTESPDDVVSSLLDPASPGEEESGS